MNGHELQRRTWRTTPIFTMRADVQEVRPIRSSLAHTVVKGALGAGYGAALMLLSVWLGAGGHGTVFPLRAASSPLYLFGNAVAFFGTIAFWSAVGAMTTSLQVSAIRHCLVALLVLHYVGIVGLIVSDMSTEGDYLLRTVRRLPVASLLAALTYAIGQVALWSRIANSLKELPLRYTLTHLLCFVGGIALVLACLRWMLR